MRKWKVCLNEKMKGVSSWEDEGCVLMRKWKVCINEKMKGVLYEKMKGVS